MTIEHKLGAPRAVFLSSASALPMLRGPSIAYSPEDDAGGGGDLGGAAEPADTGVSEQTNDNLGGDPAAAAGGEGEGGEPKPKQTAQERIDELTRTRREAERRAEAAERERDELRSKIPAAEAPKEPKPADYTYGVEDAAYVRDMAKFEARQEFEAAEREKAARVHFETIEKTWDDRQVAFAADKPDFFEKTSANDLPISPHMAHAIKTSESGAAVAYHLASNPDEARRIAALDPIAQVREVGRLEATLAGPAANPTPQAKIHSDAAKPHPQVRGQGGRFKVAPDTDDFAAFEAAHNT